MNRTSKNSVPDPYQYISKLPADTRLPRCSCSSCRAQKRLASKSHAFFPLNSSVPFRTERCKRKKQQKNVLFDGDVQVLVYDKKTGSVFENRKTDLIRSEKRKDTHTKTSTAHFRNPSKTSTKTSTKRSKDRKLEKRSAKNENTKSYMKRNKTVDVDLSPDRSSRNRKSLELDGSKRKGRRGSKKHVVKTKNKNKRGAEVISLLRRQTRNIFFKALRNKT